MEYSKIFSLIGRKAIVTGGCGYLGREVVKGLIDFGANVYVLDYKISEIEAINEKEKIHYVECDLGNTESIKSVLKSIAGDSSIDILITMAANLGAGCMSSVEDMDDEYWQKGIDGTIGYTFRTIRESIPYMKKSIYGGSIINIGSLYAVGAPDPRTYLDTPFNSTPNYGAGKAATVELTKYCASYLAKYGIRANSVSPGSFPHENVQENSIFKERLAYKTMIGRIGYPEDLVGAMIYLASDASKYVTGINIMVDGGQTAW